MIRRLAIALAMILITVTEGLAQREDLTVMTFNIRYAHTTPPNLWPDRRAVVRQVIVDSGADLVGTQEGLYTQIRDLDEALPDFEWIGLGREGGSNGEYMAIFYRPIRFVPLEYDHFWLSDTPSTIGSATWGNQIPRMVTWVRFLDRLSGREFYFVNTHFDHQSQPAREKSAQLLLERIADFDPDLPVIVTGDFNSEAPSNPVYQALTAPEALSDTWVETNEAEPEFGTFHGFEGLEAAAGRARIDWILVKGPVETIETEIITTEVDGQYPSDHFPVTARLRFR
ncbi:MAG TPA: endonuclease/exonuclease/phosphatase family protein [Longimicrobiaceae bacterium]